MTEAKGDTAAALMSYTDAARRWDSFGVVPEKGFALLGQGRCLVAEGKEFEAAGALREAREVFVALDAAPAIEQTDTILNRIPDNTL